MDRTKARSRSTDPRSKVKADPDNRESSRVVKTERNVSVKETRRESKYDDDDKKGVKLVKTKKETEGGNDDHRMVVSSVKSKKKVVEDDRKAIVSVTTKKTVVVKEKERKTFDLPGQRHEPPEERDGLRIFYESLYRQRPESEIAQIWMMEHGMLEHDEAQQILERIRGKKVQYGGSKPTASPAKGGSASNGQASRKSDTPTRKAPEGKKTPPVKILALEGKKPSSPEAKKTPVKTLVLEGKKPSDTNGKASDGKKQGTSTKSPEKPTEKSSVKVTKRRQYYSEEDDDSEEEVLPTRKRRV